MGSSWSGSTSTDLRSLDICKFKFEVLKNRVSINTKDLCTIEMGVVKRGPCTF